MDRVSEKKLCHLALCLIAVAPVTLCPSIHTPLTLAGRRRRHWQLVGGIPVFIIHLERYHLRPNIDSNRTSSGDNAAIRNTLPNVSFCATSPSWPSDGIITVRWVKHPASRRRNQNRFVCLLTGAIKLIKYRTVIRLIQGLQFCRRQIKSLIMHPSLDHYWTSPTPLIQHLYTVQCQWSFDRDINLNVKPSSRWCRHWALCRCIVCGGGQ